MNAVILQENIEGLLSLVRMLLPGGGNAGRVYLDDLSALQRSIHKQINDLYSQRGKTPEQDATLCLAILQGYNVSMYANPEDEDRKRSVLQRSLTLLDVLPPSLLKQQLSAVCHGMQELCETN
jgi:hypothetical protein